MQARQTQEMMKKAVQFEETQNDQVSDDDDAVNDSNLERKLVELRKKDGQQAASQYLARQSSMAQAKFMALQKQEHDEKQLVRQRSMSRRSIFNKEDLNKVGQQVHSSESEDEEGVDVENFNEPLNLLQ